MKNVDLNQLALPHQQVWRLPSGDLSFASGTAVMGIVNVTPDSFSDGGNFIEVERAVQHALQLESDGAAILDIGGESTRPYSLPVGVDDELRRVIPVVEKLIPQLKIPISIDTSKAAVARAAIDAGAQIINDVTGLEGDPAMIEVALQTGAAVCAMHMQGVPQTMQDNPRYHSIIDEILDYLKQRRDHLIAAGISADKICLDPGIGFGKTHQHNLELVCRIGQFHQLGCPILVGHSRKGFIGKLLGDSSRNRDAGTLAISLLLAQQGIQVIRVHEVASTVAALKVDHQLRGKLIKASGS